MQKFIPEQKHLLRTSHDLLNMYYMYKGSSYLHALLETQPELFEDTDSLTILGMYTSASTFNDIKRGCEDTSDNDKLELKQKMQELVRRYDSYKKECKHLSDNLDKKIHHLVTSIKATVKGMDEDKTKFDIKLPTVDTFKQIISITGEVSKALKAFDLDKHFEENAIVDSKELYNQIFSESWIDKLTKIGIAFQDNGLPQYIGFQNRKDIVIENNGKVWVDYIGKIEDISEDMTIAPVLGFADKFIQIVNKVRQSDETIDKAFPSINLFNALIQQLVLANISPKNYFVSALTQILKALKSNLQELDTNELFITSQFSSNQNEPLSELLEIINEQEFTNTSIEKTLSSFKRISSLFEGKLSKPAVEVLKIAESQIDNRNTVSTSTIVLDQGDDKYVIDYSKVDNVLINNIKQMLHLCKRSFSRFNKELMNFKPYDRITNISDKIVQISKLSAEEQITLDKHFSSYIPKVELNKGIVYLQNVVLLLDSIKKFKKSFYVEYKKLITETALSEHGTALYETLLSKLVSDLAPIIRNLEVEFVMNHSNNLVDLNQVLYLFAKNTNDTSFKEYNKDDNLFITLVTLNTKLKYNLFNIDEDINATLTKVEDNVQHGWIKQPCEQLFTDTVRFSKVNKLVNYDLQILVLEVLQKLNPVLTEIENVLDIQQATESFEIEVPVKEVDEEDELEAILNGKNIPGTEGSNAGNVLAFLLAMLAAVTVFIFRRNKDVTDSTKKMLASLPAKINDTRKQEMYYNTLRAEAKSNNKEAIDKLQKLVDKQESRDWVNGINSGVSGKPSKSIPPKDAQSAYTSKCEPFGDIIDLMKNDIANFRAKLDWNNEENVKQATEKGTVLLEKIKSKIENSKTIFEISGNSITINEEAYGVKNKNELYKIITGVEFSEKIMFGVQFNHDDKISKSIYHNSSFYDIILKNKNTFNSEYGNSKKSAEEFLKSLSNKASEESLAKTQKTFENQVAKPLITLYLSACVRYMMAHDLAVTVYSNPSLTL